MISSWLFRSDVPKAVAIFDIGSSSIGATIALTSNGTPRILYTSRTPIAFHRELNPEQFTKATLSALMDATLDLKNTGSSRLQPYGIRHVTEACVVFASPWSASEGVDIHLEKEKPFTLSKEMVDNAVNSEAVRYTQTTEGGVTLIERHAVGIVLNGYQYQNPYGKKAKSADIKAFFSFIPKDIEQKAYDIIRGALPGARIIAHSFPMVLFSGIRDLHTDANNTLLIDIRGELTDVAIMSGGILAHTSSFPIGERTALRMLAEKRGGRIEETISEIRLALSGKATPEITATIASELSALEGVYELSFKKVLAEYAEVGTLPEDAVLIVEGDIGSWFETMISKFDMNDVSPGRTTMRIHRITNETLSGTVASGPDTRLDPFLMLDTLFVDKLFKVSTG